MDRANIGVVLAEAKKLTSHSEYVIMGSLSVLGTIPNPPERMVMSIDVDCYPLQDPGRADEIARTLGQGSEFESQHGYYADALSPRIAALPEGWEGRLVSIHFPDEIVAYFLDPDDAAVAKLSRCQDRDKRWIREGLAAGILHPDTIEARMPSAPFLDQAEHERARTEFKKLRAWAARHGKAPP